jgi:hypothetical protein
VSAATIEFAKGGDGTALTVTGQDACLDGIDGPLSRPSHPGHSNWCTHQPTSKICKQGNLAPIPSQPWVWSRNMWKAHVGEGTMGGMALAYLVQHGEKEPLPGEPGLTGTGRHQATRTGRWLLGAGVRAVFTSPMRRARERPTA